MPLTPRFTLRQTATHVYVEISIPSFRLSLPLHDAEQEEEDGGGGGGMEVVLTGAGNSCFHFYAQPYLLKLNFFPHQFYNDDEDNEATAAGTTPAVRETAKYDPAEQTVAIPLRKKRRTATTTTTSINNDDDEETNTYWPDLDLTARLVEPTEIPKQWLHAVVDNTNTNVNDNDNDNDTTDTTDDTNTTTAKNDKEANSNGPDHDDENALETTRQPTNPLLLPGHETKTADGYGFQTMFRNIFTDYCRSGLAEEMLQLRGAVDPEASTLAERQGQRHATEEHDFDFDRYYHDLDLAESDDYLYPLVMHYQPWWQRPREQQQETIRTTQAQNNSKSKYKNKNTNGVSLGGLEDALESKLTVTPSSSDCGSNHNNEKDKVASSDPPPISISIFTEDEKLLLTTIPYPLLPENLLSTQNDTITTTNTTTDTKNYDLWCGLIEIVLAYVYDHLTTMGDPTVESAWTISILSPGLSYLESPHPHTASIENVLYTCLRRVAIYPYWRNIDELGLYHIIRETLDLIKMHGIHGITKCLLQTRVILEKSESYYLGNKLFIDPYLYWIQNLNQAEGKVILNRIVTEMEDVLVAAPCDNTLLMKVQNSLGIDVLMDDLFHTDSDTGSFSVSSSDDDDDDDNDSETDTTTEIELDENDEINNDEDNDSDNDILLKNTTVALSAVSIRVDGTQNGVDDDRLLVDRGTPATPTKERLACSSPAAGNTTNANETTITATEKITKSSKLLLHFEDKNINDGITKATAKKPLITEL